MNILPQPPEWDYGSEQLLIQREDRPRLMSQKTREKSVKKHPLFEQRSCEFGRFSCSSVNFVISEGRVKLA